MNLKTSLPSLRNEAEGELKQSSRLRLHFAKTVEIFLESLSHPPDENSRQSNAQQKTPNTASRAEFLPPPPHAPYTTEAHTVISLEMKGKINLKFEYILMESVSINR
jgi:hypothetical protein